MDACLALIQTATISYDNDKWIWGFNGDDRYATSNIKEMIERKMSTKMDGAYENNSWLPIIANFVLYWRSFFFLNCVPTRVSLA